MGKTPPPARNDSLPVTVRDKHNHHNLAIPRGRIAVALHAEALTEDKVCDTNNDNYSENSLPHAGISYILFSSDLSQRGS